MKKTASKILLLACTLASSGTQAWAEQEVSVGRVDVQLPGDGWQVHSIEDKGNTISGDGYTYQQAVEYKVMARRAPDQMLDALVMVRASASGKGRFSGLFFSNVPCDGAHDMYAEGDKPGVAARSFRCLRVLAPRMRIAASDLPDEVRELMTKLGWSLPPTMFVLSSTQHATTGAFTSVVAYLRPLVNVPSNNPSQSPPETLPSGVSAASVQWGRRLQEAVSDSVYSIRGKLVVPDMPFAEVVHEPLPLPGGLKLPAAPARVPLPHSSNQG